MTKKYEGPQRVERIPVINKSRGKVRYIKYIDPLRAFVSKGFFNNRRRSIPLAAQERKGKEPWVWALNSKGAKLMKRLYKAEGKNIMKISEQLLEDPYEPTHLYHQKTGGGKVKRLNWNNIKIEFLTQQTIGYEF
jgi:hypothetical protein